jgi:hypothetical protein
MDTAKGQINCAGLGGIGTTVGETGQSAYHDLGIHGARQETCGRAASLNCQRPILFTSPMSSAEPKIAPLIRTIRERRVILDADLAALYGVPTKLFNQAFKRNRNRFPPEFAFRLTSFEFAVMDRSQTVTGRSQNNAKETVMHDPSTPVMGSSRHRSTRYRPRAFTEHGALMAANILRSPRAREMSVFIIRAYRV